MIPRRVIDLLCLGVAMTLLAHAPHLPLWLSAAMAGALGLRWWRLRAGAGPLPTWLKLVLIGLLFLAVLNTWSTIFGRAPGSALAVGLLILKLMETRRPRDVQHAVVFAAFVLMSALLFDQGMAFTVLVIAGLVPNLAALAALQPRGPAPAWGREWPPVLRSLGLALPLALLMFVFLPRLASPLWGAPNFEAARTGLSNRMSPGNLTELLTDDSPALRVSFAGPPPKPAQRYFRGWVMSYFDGRTWHHLRRRGQAPAAAPADATLVNYSIQLEPTGGRLVPALDVPRPAKGLYLSADHSLFRPRRLESISHFQLQAAIGGRLPAALDAAARQRNLDLPTGYNPRARELARGWRQRFGDDAAAIAGAALAMYHNDGFVYTLAPAPLGRHSVDDFLFSTREGFCEHYASSFAFLMRAAGVPARVVTGYQGGWWNPYGDYLLVRKSDAHAWVEIWVAGEGWLRYDPTAAVRRDRVQLGAGVAGAGAAWYQSGWIRALRNHWDIVNRLWDKTLVAFNAERQRRLLTPFGVPKAGLRELTTVLVAGFVLLLGLATFVTVYRRRRPDRLQAIQQHLERHLARSGVPRRANEGPRDYMQRVMAARPASRERINLLYRRYMHLRYARQAPEPGEVAAYGELVRESIRQGMVQ